MLTAVTIRCNSTDEVVRERSKRQMNESSSNFGCAEFEETNCRLFLNFGINIICLTILS